MSPMGFAVLTGAGLVDASAGSKLSLPMRKTVTGVCTVAGKLDIDLGDHVSVENPLDETRPVNAFVMNGTSVGESLAVTIDETTSAITAAMTGATVGQKVTLSVLFYRTQSSSATQINVSPDKFGGYYSVEAETLFRRMDGVDLPAIIQIPKAKVQSAFSFAMSPTGDPASFSFTVDAFPDYLPGSTEKTLVAINVIEAE